MTAEAEQKANSWYDITSCPLMGLQIHISTCRVTAFHLLYIIGIFLVYAYLTQWRSMSRGRPIMRTISATEGRLVRYVPQSEQAGSLQPQAGYWRSIQQLAEAWQRQLSYFRLQKMELASPSILLQNAISTFAVQISIYLYGMTLEFSCSSISSHELGSLSAEHLIYWRYHICLYHFASSKFS